jgi:hypothetical protein
MDVSCKRWHLDTWLMGLHRSQVNFLRKSSGSRLNVFVPVNDLSSLSRGGLDTRTLVAGRKNDLAIAGGQILGDEYSDHVVKVSQTPVRSSSSGPNKALAPKWDHPSRKVCERQGEEVA